VEQKGTRFQSGRCKRNGSRKGLDFSPGNVVGTVVEKNSVQSRKCGRNGSRNGLDFSPRSVEGSGAERD